MTRGTPVVDALEAFYAMSVEDLSGELDRGLAAARALDLSTEEVLARLQCGDFLATYLEQCSRAQSRAGWGRSIWKPEYFGPHWSAGSSLRLMRTGGDRC